MSEQVLRVFVSHTSEFREFPPASSFVAAVEEAIAMVGWAVTDMKYFAVRDRLPSETCIEKVAQADIYVGVIGFRFGSPVLDRADVSYTELEFNAATDLPIPRLMFLLSEKEWSPIPPNQLHDSQHGERQLAFRKRLRDIGLVIGDFNTPETLKTAVYQALVEERDRLAKKAAVELPKRAARPVRVLCHPKDAGRADGLARRLRSANFSVEPADMNAPVVVCATYIAVATGWLAGLRDEVDTVPSEGVFVVEMDEDMTQLSLGNVISGYWRDPDAAVGHLRVALDALFPEEPEVSESLPEAAAAADEDFMDIATRLTTFDASTLADFRRQLRPDRSSSLPESLSPQDFLRRAGLLRDGRLTRAAVLLFGEIPTNLLPSAVVQCVRYYGTEKDASRDRIDIHGNVTEQITRARDFIAERAQVGEAPSVSGAATEPVYRYPMVAVREVIANALVHRDYQDFKRAVHVRMFTDRVEITSPGSWEGRALPDNEEQPIASLAGESRRRNFRLADTLTWIRLVEGEGSGIPSAVRDCDRLGTPPPTVTEQDGFVRVTLHPRTERTPRIFISHTGEDRAWAEWARWHLQAAGYPTELDSVDWPAGTNVVQAMHRALNRQNPMLILLSGAYLDPDRFTSDEWTARLVSRLRDPDAKLIPLRVGDVELSGLWTSIAAPDVANLPADQAVTVLINAVRDALGPSAAGTSSGEPPAYPGLGKALDQGPRTPGSLPQVWNLARRNPAFTGRDDMLNLLHDTLGADNRAAVQALHGLGGVGKTQLTLEYAHRFANEYDLAWWITAEQPELIGDQLVALAVASGVAAAGTDVVVALDALRAYLRGRSRWLLVFDNAENRDDLASWLPDGPGHVIITSRNPAWTGVAQAVELDVFNRDESTLLLRTHLPYVDDQDADRLAEALGDLPLAIEQAAGLLAETNMSVDAYLAELQTHAGDLLRDGRPPAGYPVPLAAAVTIAARRLTDDDPAAGQLIFLCAFLGPEPIPADLFTARPDLIQPPLADAARRPVRFARTVSQLFRYGLARTTAAGPVLHRLTQAVLRDIESDPQTQRRTVEQLLVAARPGDPAMPAFWPRWSQLLPHILAIEPATTDNSDMRWVATDAVRHLLARGDLRTALPLAERLRTAWTRRYGRDDQTGLAAAHALATTYRLLGRYQEARHLGEDTLVRRQRILGDDHPDTLISADTLAAALRGLGEFKRAREMDEGTLARRRRVLGDDYPETLVSASNLAADLRALGEYQRAREIEEETLPRFRRVLGDDHPDTLTSAGNLAAVLRHLGEHERARSLAEDTLERRRRVLGDDHPDTHLSASTLAAYLRELGEVERARELEQAFGVSDPVGD